MMIIIIIITIIITMILIVVFQKHARFSLQTSASKWRLGKSEFVLRTK
jgi:hypothetical protein